MRLCWLVLVTSLALSCAEPRDQRAAARRDAIVGGADDPADSQVFLIDMTFDNAARTVCSATLVAPRSLVTAAHCIDPRRQSGATSVSIKATNKMVAAQAGTSELFDVVDSRLHPLWDPGASSSPQDIAMLLLDAPVAGVTPKGFNRAGLSGFPGKTMRAVGYGRTDSATSNSGTRRAVSVTVTSDDINHIFFGASGSAGICSGDSGGPSLHTFSDGVERIVGVHSYQMSPACGDGADVRIDRFLSFIDQWFADKDPALCSGDGRCNATCSPADPDCVCAADAVCSALCPDPDLDPDCPRDCAQNAVCATGACPVADPDCVAVGQPCSTEVQCAGRSCVSDPQHPARYCSRACSSPADCPSGMQCLSSLCALGQLTPAGMGDPCTPGVSWCAEGAACTGPDGAATTCRPSCDLDGGCPSGSSCASGQNAAHFCQAEVTSPPPDDAGAVGHVGCGAAGDAQLAWPALLVLLAAACRPGDSRRPAR